MGEARSNTSMGLNFDRQVLEAESNLNMAKMQGRFDAEINASYGLTQTAIDFNQAFNKPLDEERVSVGITIPILDWGQAKGRIKMAEGSRDEACGSNKGPTLCGAHASSSQCRSCC